MGRRRRNPFGAADDFDTLEVAKDALREEDFKAAAALLKNISPQTLSRYVIATVRRYMPSDVHLYGLGASRLPADIRKRLERLPDGWTFVYIHDELNASGGVRYKWGQARKPLLGDVCEQIQAEEDPLIDGCWWGVDNSDDGPIQYIYVIPFSRDLRISGVGYPWWKNVPDEVMAEYAKLEAAPKKNPPERDLEKTIIDLAMQGQPEVLADLAIEAGLVPPHDPYGYEEYRKQHPDQDPEKDRTYLWSKRKQPQWRAGEFAVEQPSDYPRSLVWWMAMRGSNGYSAFDFEVDAVAEGSNINFRFDYNNDQGPREQSFGGAWSRGYALALLYLLFMRRWREKHPFIELTGAGIRSEMRRVNVARERLELRKELAEQLQRYLQDVGNRMKYKSNPSRASSSPNPDHAAAIEKYEEFTQLAPKKVGEFAASFKLPKRVRCVGEAKSVLYRSDKIDPASGRDPGKGIDYIHEHEGGVKLYVCSGELDTDVPDWITKVTALTKLGTCLGYDFTYKSGEKGEAQAKRPMPELYTIPSGRCLIVVQDKREVLAMMWGGDLGVEDRGIVG